MPLTDSRFERLVLQTPDGARAEVSAHGAQVLHWQTATAPDNRLYLSPLAQYRADQAIRGGIPVLFPQFGLFGTLPKHGLVRTRHWQPVPGNTPSRLCLTLPDDAASRACWPHAFRLTLSVSLSAQALEVGLEVVNTGATAFSFTVGLHSYLAVNNLQQLRLHGLSGLDYLDAASRLAQRRDTADAVAVHGEIDRVYVGAREPLSLRDAGRDTAISQTGFTDVVVWNPGPQATLADLPQAAYQDMLCVEAAVIAQPVVLLPGARWQGAQRLEAVAPAS